MDVDRVMHAMRSAVARRCPESEPRGFLPSNRRECRVALERKQVAAALRGQ